MVDKHEKLTSNWSIKSIIGTIVTIFAILAVEFVPIVYALIVIGLPLAMICISMRWMMENLSVKGIYRRKLSRIRGKIYREDNNARQWSEIHEITPEIAKYALEGSLIESDMKDELEQNKNYALPKLLRCGICLLCVCLIQNDSKNLAFAALKKGVLIVKEELTVESVESLGEMPVEDEIKQEKLGRVEGIEDSDETVIIPWGYFIEYPEETVEIPVLLKASIFYEEAENLTASVEHHIELLILSRQLEESVEGIVDSFGRDAGMLSEFEKKLDNLAKEAQSTGNLAEWSQKAPDINQLLNLVHGREEIQENNGSSQMCFLIANDYQRCALEYQLRESGNANQIILYYALSIHYAEQALSYENNSLADQMHFLRYIKARYKDISDCERVTVGIRERANEIAGILDDMVLD